MRVADDYIYKFWLLDGKLSVLEICTQIISFLKTTAIALNMPKKFSGNFDKGSFRNFIFRLVIFTVVILLLFPLLLKFFDTQYNSSLLYSLTYLKTSVFGIVAVAMFVALNKKKLLDFEYGQNVKETLLFSLLSILMMLAYFTFTRMINPIYVVNYFSIVVLVSYFAHFLSVFFVFLAIFNYVFFRKFFSSVSISFLASILFFFFTTILWANWGYFSGFAAKLSQAVLSLFFSNSQVIFGRGDPVLGLDSFSVAVGAPCSGIESIAMFSGLFLVMASYDWEKIAKNKILPIFLAGVAGIFLMSIARIIVLMLVGAKWSPQIALSLFHANAGWIFFVAYFFAFVLWIYPVMIRE